MEEHIVEIWGKASLGTVAINVAQLCAVSWCLVKDRTRET